MKIQIQKTTFRQRLKALCPIAIGLLSFAFQIPDAHAQGTDFTYQGTLESDGAPANGFFDMQFTLKTTETVGFNIGSPITRTDVPAIDGVFSVELDFGEGAFSGTNRWLEIQVEGTTLSPRQKVNSAPVAAGLPNVTVDSERQVGIGTTNPSRLLHVSNGSSGQLVNFSSDMVIEDDQGAYLQLNSPNVWSAGLSFGKYGSDRDGAIRYTSLRELCFDVAANQNVMKIAATGNVGIGTASPIAPLHVASTAFIPYLLDSRFMDFGAQDFDPAINQHGPIAIRSDNFILAEAFLVESDERIKEIKGHSDASLDLATLSEIKITDYTYTDEISKGSRLEKKVIAQQIDEVFPQAVSKTSSVIPDIYKKASAKKGWIALATELKVGERVKIIEESGEGLHEVLEVGDVSFRVASQDLDGDVFVYGREVDDFHTVDYDALSMLNISATQEIYRQLQAEQAKNSELENRQAALEKSLAVLMARDKERDAKFAKLERLLEGTPPVVAPVLSKVQGSAFTYLRTPEALIQGMPAQNGGAK